MPTLKRCIYSNMVIGTLAIDGWAVIFGTASRGHVQSPPHCTKYNSSPINGQCTNFILFDVALWTLKVNSVGTISNLKTSFSTQLMSVT